MIIQQYAAKTRVIIHKKATSMSITTSNFGSYIHQCQQSIGLLISTSICWIWWIIIWLYPSETVMLYVSTLR